MKKELTQWIKVRAREQGFSKIGLTRAEPLEQEGEYLEQWLRWNYHAGMQWIEQKKDLRKNPLQLFPSAKSILCVALNYYAPIPNRRSVESVKIARYALGVDYHKVLRNKLRALLKEIQTRVPQCEGLVCVDSAPVMEKVWAQRSGLGWIGKNTLLLTREYGSWVFLGVIILSIELEYDLPARTYCGTCRACIDACPTNALVQEYVLDARRCISYLTIEHRGEIPLELARHSQGWIYGCDRCQEVCPWNKFATPTEEQSFLPKESLLRVSVQEICTWAERDFSAYCVNTPIERCGYERFLRNVTTMTKWRKESERSQDSPQE